MLKKQCLRGFFTFIPRVKETGPLNPPSTSKQMNEIAE